MNETSFEKLEVNKLAEQLGDCLWEIVVSWKSFERDTVGKRAQKQHNGRYQKSNQNVSRISVLTK